MESIRLAAIMFTDIAGYSAMMEKNEPRTIELIGKHNEIVFPIIASLNGEVVDAIGDGLLIMFPSVYDAVRCALRIHESIHRFNEQSDGNSQFLLRIGIHQGEVWLNDNRVFGNGVNIAARIQPFAAPGGICLSEDAQRQIANKIEGTIQSIGVKPLKNISRRIELFRVVTGYEDSEAPTESVAEFDEIKEKLLLERQKITQRKAASETRDPDDLGKAIENRVFNFVERVMDTAIEKWDKIPEEKKPAVSVKSDKHIDIRFDTAPPAPPLEPKKPEKPVNPEKPKQKKVDFSRNIIAGLTFGTGFGFGFFVFDVSWMLVPFFLFGVLPLTIGLGKIIKRIAVTRAQKLLRPKELEKQVLKSAAELGGRVTVVQIANKTGISLDEAGTILDDMTKRGYVLQHILDSGIIQYEFPSLTDSYAAQIPGSRDGDDETSDIDA